MFGLFGVVLPLGVNAVATAGPAFAPHPDGAAAAFFIVSVAVDACAVYLLCMHTVLL